MMPLVIVEPFSLMGDTVAGDTPSDVALNLAGCTHVSLAFRCKLRRPAPDLKVVFRGRKLTSEAKDACRWVTSVYDRLRRIDAAPEPQNLSVPGIPGTLTATQK